LTNGPSFATLERVFGELTFVGSWLAELAADGWQPSLLTLGEREVDVHFCGVQRVALDATSWIDHVPRWLTGADDVFAELVTRVPWRQRRVVMYDRLVDEPRLSWWWQQGSGPFPVDLPVLHAAARALGSRYGCEFDSIGCNLYRQGSDSVAWHGDRVRHSCADPVVAIVSVGSPRPFQIRPRGGGSCRSFLLGHGDLLVMGGACQHDWEHSVPKVARAGPRLSITYRHGLPRPDARDRHIEVTRAAHPSARLGAAGGVGLVGTPTRGAWP
jgi:alkylated DNA repair dioxygenase AlkB